MFYNNLKEACENEGLKITPTVIECGGKAGSIGGWKKGAAPNSDIVMKLATRLNVTTDYLLFGRSNIHTDELEDEHRLIKAYRQLTDEGKRTAIKFVEYTAQDPQYKKYTDIPKEA